MSETARKYPYGTDTCFACGFTTVWTRNKKDKFQYVCGACGSRAYMNGDPSAEKLKEYEKSIGAVVQPAPKTEPEAPIEQPKPKKEPVDDFLV